MKQKSLKIHSYYFQPQNVNLDDVFTQDVEIETNLFRTPKGVEYNQSITFEFIYNGKRTSTKIHFPELMFSPEKLRQFADELEKVQKEFNQK